MLSPVLLKQPENGYCPKLYISSTEQNPGLRQNYFDAVYSIHAIGRTADQQIKFNKFLWERSFLHCADAVDAQPALLKNVYFEWRSSRKKPAPRRLFFAENMGFPTKFDERKLLIFIEKQDIFYPYEIAEGGRFHRRKTTGGNYRPEAGAPYGYEP